MTIKKVILDAGHAGMAWKHYLNVGKQSPEVPPGIYEGEFNRLVVDIIDSYFSTQQSLPLVVGPINAPLKNRVLTINQIAELEDVALVSIHSNASPREGWSNASGFRVFTTVNCSTESSRLANRINDELSKADLPYPGRPIGAEAFCILRESKCPAVLVECGFMTCKKDAVFMASSEGQAIIGKAIARGIQRFFNEE